MKILQINNFNIGTGGADVVYFNTSELLRKNGHRISSFTLAHEKNEPNAFASYFPKADDYRSLSFVGKIKSVKNFFNHKEAAVKLARLIQDEKPDIAHIHLFLGGLTTSILKVLEHYKIPVVHSIHDYRLVCPAYTFLTRKNQVCEACKDGLFFRCALKRCSLEGRFTHSTMLALEAYYRRFKVNPVKLIDHFIFVSKFSHQKHLYFNDEFGSKSSVLYNFRPGIFSKSDVRGDYILYYGRLSREKGLETLIKSAEILKFKLKIVGTGPLYENLKNKENENIEVLGFKKGDELWALIQNSSFVIVPSEWYENNPLTIVEAFSFGKPVIGSDIGGIPELIMENRGVLFKPQDVNSLNQSIQRALQCSDSDYNTMAQNAYDFALANFSESSNYESLMKIYNSILNG